MWIDLSVCKRLSQTFSESRFFLSLLFVVDWLRNSGKSIWIHVRHVHYIEICLFASTSYQPLPMPFESVILLYIFFLSCVCWRNFFHIFFYSSLIFLVKRPVIYEFWYIYVDCSLCEMAGAARDPCVCMLLCAPHSME